LDDPCPACAADDGCYVPIGVLKAVQSFGIPVAENQIVDIPQAPDKLPIRRADASDALFQILPLVRVVHVTGCAGYQLLDAAARAIVRVLRHSRRAIGNRN
jgi:hypothetical protein